LYELSARGVSRDRLCDGHLPKGRKEQSLVDPTIEDRDAQLNAFDDDIASFETSFARELGGRQMVCHTGVSPLQRFTTWQEVLRLARTGTTSKSTKVGVPSLGLLHFAVRLATFNFAEVD
jgi:hypothetical protein